MLPSVFRRHLPLVRVNQRARILVVIFSCVATDAAAAQSVPDAVRTRRAPTTAADTLPPLTLAAVHARLASHNPRLAAARADVDAADARVATAATLPDPRLQLGIMNRDLPSLRPMETLGMDQLQVMQMVPIGGKLASAGRAAEARAASTRARASARWWELRRDATVAFYDLWATDRRLTVARESQALLAQAADAAESMYRVGQGRQADVLRAQMEVTRMSEEVLRMRTMRTTLVARLGGLLRLDIEADTLTLRIPRLAAVFADSAADSPDRFLRLAATNRPMLAAGRSDAAAAAASEQLARRELWPDLEVGVQLARRPPSAAPPGMPATADWMTSLMLGASVPIFARSRQLQMRAEASAMRAAAEADVVAMETDTRAMVREVLAMLRQSRALEALYAHTLVPQAIAARDAAAAEYRTGSVDFMTVLDAHMNANKIRQEQYTLRAAEGSAIAELEMLIGRSLTDEATLLPLEDEIR